MLFSASASSISRRAPPPIMLRKSMPGGGSPSRVKSALRVAIKSGAVSTSVPSRSNTMVAGAMGLVAGIGRPRRTKRLAISKPLLRSAAWDAIAHDYNRPWDARRGLGTRRGRRRGLVRRAPANIQDADPYLPPMNSEDYKRKAAAAALEFVEPGMRLGLGTGSTATP